MYRKQKKIPTLFALFILFAGLGTAVYLDRNQQSLGSYANTPLIPEEIHISNITDNSFTVSFLTSNPTTGSIIVSTNSQKLTFLDDLDSDAIPRPRITHSITAKNLTEQTSYLIKITTAGGNCKQDLLCPTISQVTAPKITNSLSIPPVHGTIFKNSKKNPASNALVYVQVGKNALLSSRADSSGLWVIPLTNLRSNDLSIQPQLTDNDLIQITIKQSLKDSATAVIDVKSIKQNFAIPEMTIGNSFNFVNLVTKKGLLAKNTTQNVLGTNISPATVNILFPKQDLDTTTDNRPRIRGSGIGGTQILITLNSTPQTGKVTVENDGTWSWRPQNELSSGIHHLSISTYDQKGNVATQTRDFIILKSGERVLGDSTPSASLTPTSFPPSSPTSTVIPTPLVTLTPNPSSTPIPTLLPNPTSIPPESYAPTIPPRSGFLQPIMYLLGAGGSLLFVGTILLIL